VQDSITVAKGAANPAIVALPSPMGGGSQPVGGYPIYDGMTQFRRLAPALVLLPLLAACATADPSAPGVYIAGAGDPVRGAALNAPFQFGALEKQRGQPAKVALSLTQLEYLTAQIPASGYWQNQVSGTTILALQLGRTEMRRALGIRPDAQPAAVMSVGARAALSTSDFTLGGEGTLQRLANLPPLPQAAAAAGQVNNDVMGLNDLPFGR
jgi:hypothetical protein